MPPRHSHYRHKAHDSTVQKLIDNNLIGLSISPDFKTYAQRSEETPKREFKPRAATEGEIKKIDIGLSEPPVKKIQNYCIFRPYNFGNVKFIHGRSLFSREHAAQFFEHGKRDDSLFNPEVVQDVADALSIPSFQPRVFGMIYAHTKTQAEMMSISFGFAEKLYPQLRLGEFLPITEENMEVVIPQILKRLEEHNINISQTLEKKNFSPEDWVLCEKHIKPIADQELADFYKRHQTGKTAEFIARYKTALEGTLEKNHFDVEIIHNFEAAVHSATLGKEESFEQLLKAGARIRAVSALRTIAESMTNPYDNVFETAERSVAETMADYIQPIVIDAIAKQKVVTVLTDTHFINTLFRDILNLQTEVMHGKYHPSFPASPYYTSFVFGAGFDLYPAELGPWLRHEYEHFVDFSQGQSFVNAYAKDIPSMIENDLKNFRAKKEYISSLDETASKEEKKDFYMMLRRSGTKPNDEEFVEQKNALLAGFSHISDRLSMFAPTDGNDTPHYQKLMNTEISFLEIPAIIEELKGKYGRQFIAELLPELSRACDRHRTQLLRPEDSIVHRVALRRDGSGLPGHG